MKKQFFHLFCVCALILGASACNNKPDINFDKTDYLALAHSTLGKSSKQAEKILKKQKFVPQEASTGYINYVLYNADSTRNVIINLLQNADTIKQYSLLANLQGDAQYEQAKTLYTKWSNTAYRSLLADVSVWNGSITPEDGEGTSYMDGGMMAMISNMVELYHMSGNLDDDVYNAIRAALNNKRANFEEEMKSGDFFYRGEVNEMIAHATTSFNLDLTDITGSIASLAKMRGNLGILTGNVQPADDMEGTPLTRIISFTFMADKSLQDISFF